MDEHDVTIIAVNRVQSRVCAIIVMLCGSGDKTTFMNVFISIFIALPYDYTNNARTHNLTIYILASGEDGCCVG